jgi:Sec1 family.
MFYTASYFLYVYFVGGSISSQSSQNDTPRVVLVFFLGGCTFAEVSALRFLSQQEDCKTNFVSNHLLPATPLLAELPAQPFFTLCAYFAA